LAVAGLLAGTSCATTKASRPVIESVKQNGICFRLMDYRQRIEYFEKQGQSDRAEAERKKQREYNQYVRQLFKENFDFCPVYFFYASQNEALLEGCPVLLNDNLEVDPSIPLPAKVHITAYSVRDVGESIHGSERFYILGTGIEVRPAFFMPSESNKKFVVPENAPVDAQGFVFRVNQFDMIAKDVYKFNKQLYKVYSNPK
jgi:regulator of replication initiation timing